MTTIEGSTRGRSLKTQRVVKVQQAVGPRFLDAQEIPPLSIATRGGLLRTISAAVLTVLLTTVALGTSSALALRAEGSAMGVYIDEEGVRNDPCPPPKPPRAEDGFDGGIIAAGGPDCGRTFRSTRFGDPSNYLHVTSGNT
jgi:hypothetical protein